MKIRSRSLQTLALVLATLTIMTVVYSFWDTPPIIQKLPALDRNADVKVIGLTSDTHAHFPILGERIPERVFEIFKEANVSMIIHAGDLTKLEVVKELERIAPVEAVYGNMDPPEIRTVLPAMTVIKVNGWRIGVTHNIGFPPFWGATEMEKIAKENDLDVLVFGHTHKPFLRSKGGVIFINPGSPVDPFPPFLVKRTIGLLIITEGKIEPYIIEV